MDSTTATVSVLSFTGSHLRVAINGTRHDVLLAIGDPEQEAADYFCSATAEMDGCPPDVIAALESCDGDALQAAIDEMVARLVADEGGPVIVLAVAGVREAA